ncbi:(2Fe-2S) ferredoxin domain-containing protein [Solimonas terrae]|uniref:(2Fe-2S) ferredoxin domain-containing protein n=2 Tax=Solimonas terrae TaxID=1396819 RepID=A0A6M2BRK2_9GAMM|nr:(2Fe-2S) ferredoxin domain-containing protein [Solimonas terrae]
MDGARSDNKPSARRLPTRARASWDDAVFVCSKCMKRQKDEWRGPPLRKQLKQALKARGLGKRLRVVPCGCLDLCPKHGVTMARGSELRDAGKLRVLRNGDDPRTAIDWLSDLG